MARAARFYGTPCIRSPYTFSWRLDGLDSGWFSSLLLFVSLSDSSRVLCGSPREILRFFLFSSSVVLSVARGRLAPSPFLPPRDQANALTSPFLHRLCSSVPTVALHPSRLASSTISLDRLIDESKGKFEKRKRKRIVDAVSSNLETNERKLIIVSRKLDGRAVSRFVKKKGLEESSKSLKSLENGPFLPYACVPFQLLKFTSSSSSYLRTRSSTKVPGRR